MGSRISARRRIGLREFPSVLFACDDPYGGDDGGGDGDDDDDGLKLRKIKANEHSANAKNATSKTSS